MKSKFCHVGSSLLWLHLAFFSTEDCITTEDGLCTACTVFPLSCRRTVAHARIVQRLAAEEPRKPRCHFFHSPISLSVVVAHTRQTGPLALDLNLVAQGHAAQNTSQQGSHQPRQLPKPSSCRMKEPVVRQPSLRPPLRPPVLRQFQPPIFPRQVPEPHSFLSVHLVAFEKTSLRRPHSARASDVPMHDVI